MIACPTSTEWSIVSPTGSKSDSPGRSWQRQREPGGMTANKSAPIGASPAMFHQSFERIMATLEFLSPQGLFEPSRTTACEKAPNKRRKMPASGDPDMRQQR